MSKEIVSQETVTDNSDEKTILLTHEHYVHIIDENTGEIRLIEGPARLQLKSHESVHGKGIEKKIVLRSHQYCRILNPIKNGKIQEGEREIRKGPQIFSLYPGEILEYGQIQEAISIAKDEGIYIHDIKDGTVRLELGPKQIFLGAYEELFRKELTDREIKALKLDSDYPRHKAVSIELYENEVIQLYDREITKVELGPKRVFLQPFERPKVVKLSGNTPKRPGVLIKSKITLSPSFISDILRVRTKDNAVLKLHVRYKQRFNVDPDNLGRIYLISDFVGFATETLASEIREEAAKHNFEEFHTNTYDIIRDLLFPKKEGVRQYREFDNGLEIFSVDIKSITPEDPEIANKLNAAISNNMDIYVQKILQQAELEARQELIKGEKNLEKLRKDLIELKNTNLRDEKIGKTKIDAQAEIVKATGLAEAENIKTEALKKAEVDRVKKMKETLNELDSENYLKLVELQSISKFSKSYIMRSDSKIRIPYTNQKTSE
ncbi:MAG: SPFH domain-containing protein [Candidatus Odinarchaeota archaeon]